MQSRPPRPPDAATKHLAASRPRFVRELQRFIQFPSVSAAPSRAADVKRCAAWLAAHLSSIGMRHARVISTKLHPLVYADWALRPDAPTLLFYGHYDVQPEDPITAWRSPPFAARLIDGRIIGRGASDDKGQLFAHVKAIECALRSSAALPLNVRCIFEGEEEIGSPSLTPFLERHARSLRCDAVLMSDMQMLAPGRPAIGYSVRGQLGLELEIRGQRRELHSGTYGGMIHNPIQAAAEILSRLHTPAGRIAIPGFYDDVRATPSAERLRMRRAGPPDQQLLREAAADRPWGEPGFTAYERLTIRPALTFNGICGGYHGPGAKAVIPTSVTVKLSFRLVPDQQPDRVEALFRQYLLRITPSTTEIRIRRTLAALPAQVARNHPAMSAAAAACRAGFGADPVFIRLGGSIPIVEAFSRVLHAPAILLGYGLPDDNIHAPNEKFDLRNFFQGIRTTLAFLHELPRALNRRRPVPTLQSAGASP